MWIVGEGPWIADGIQGRRHFRLSLGQPVAVLNHNKVMAYMVPPKLYEDMLELIDDLELARIVRERLDNPVGRVRVDIDEI